MSRPSPRESAASLAAGSSGQAQCRPPSATLLTRVSLAFVHQRVNLYLRFGYPHRETRLDRWQRYAYFLPGAQFARVLWEGNEHGTTRWQVMVLQACKPLDAMQRIGGIRPGARILLHAEGERRVRVVLAQIDIIEALGIDPDNVSLAYWQTLGNRLAAGLPIPIYTAERHAIWLGARGLL